jgi:hypothetical protein
VHARQRSLPLSSIHSQGSPHEAPENPVYTNKNLMEKKKIKRLKRKATEALRNGLKKH